MEDIMHQAAVEMVEEDADVLSHDGMSNAGAAIQQLQKIVNTPNGSVVTAKDVRVSRSIIERNRDKAALCDGFARYRQYADKQMDVFLNKKPD